MPIKMKFEKEEAAPSADDDADVSGAEAAPSVDEEAELLEEEATGETSFIEVAREETTPSMAEATDAVKATPSEEKKAEGNAGVKPAAEHFEPIKLLEAALFLANRPLDYKELEAITGLKKVEVVPLLDEISKHYHAGRAVELYAGEETVSLHVRPKYLSAVSHLSKQVELSKKALKILALVSKKKYLLQSELKNYFRGEIYDYTTELRQAGYIESKRHGNTRLLKPSQKFYDNFQII